MNKNQKIVLYGGVAVFAALVAMVGILIYSNWLLYPSDGADDLTRC